MHARRGYIALLSVIIVSAIAAATVLILFITSLSSTLNTGNISEGEMAHMHADACAELALQCVTDGSSDPQTNCSTGLNFTNQGACRIVSITDVGGGQNWVIRTSGSGLTNTITRYIEVDAYRHTAGSAATIVNWRECRNLNTTPPTDCVTE